MRGTRGTVLVGHSWGIVVSSTSLLGRLSFLLSPFLLFDFGSNEDAGHSLLDFSGQSWSFQKGCLCSVRSCRRFEIGLLLTKNSTRQHRSTIRRTWFFQHQLSHYALEAVILDDDFSKSLQQTCQTIFPGNHDHDRTSSTTLRRFRELKIALLSCSKAPSPCYSAISATMALRVEFREQLASL